MSTHDTTWYVVADGGKARILTRHDDHFHTIHTFNAEGTGDIDEDASKGEHQLKAPHADPKAEIKHEFGRVVADYLNRAPASEVQDIVLAAPGHVLHDIREALNKATAAKLTRSLSKDLTNISDHAIAEHFGK
jgi:protein required for attachment to host cells